MAKPSKPSNKPPPSIEDLDQLFEQTKQRQQLGQDGKGVAVETPQANKPSPKADQWPELPQGQVGHGNPASKPPKLDGKEPNDAVFLPQSSTEQTPAKKSGYARTPQRAGPPTPAQMLPPPKQAHTSHPSMPVPPIRPSPKLTPPKMPTLFSAQSGTHPEPAQPKRGEDDAKSVSPVSRLNQNLCISPMPPAGNRDRVENVADAQNRQVETGGECCQNRNFENFQKHVLSGLQGSQPFVSPTNSAASSTPRNPPFSQRSSTPRPTNQQNQTRPLPFQPIQTAIRPTKSPMYVVDDTDRIAAYLQQTNVFESNCKQPPYSDPSQDQSKTDSKQSLSKRPPKSDHKGPKLEIPLPTTDSKALKVKIIPTSNSYEVNITKTGDKSSSDDDSHKKKKSKSGHHQHSHSASKGKKASSRRRHRHERKEEQHHRDEKNDTKARQPHKKDDKHRDKDKKNDMNKKTPKK